MHEIEALSHWNFKAYIWLWHLCKLLCMWFLICLFHVILRPFMSCFWCKLYVRACVCHLLVTQWDVVGRSVLSPRLSSSARLRAWLMFSKWSRDCDFRNQDQSRPWSAHRLVHYSHVCTHIAIPHTVTKSLFFCYLYSCNIKWFLTHLPSFWRVLKNMIQWT